MCTHVFVRQDFYTKGRSSLKWVFDHRKDNAVGSEESISMTENFLTMSQILEKNGFKPSGINLTAQEKEVAMQLIEDNKTMYQHEVPPVEHEKMECLSRWYWVEDHGQLRKRFRKETETMAKSHDNAKSVKDDLDGVAPREEVKIETHPRAAEAKKAHNEMKKTCSKLGAVTASLSAAAARVEYKKEAEKSEKIQRAITLVQGIMVKAFAAKEDLGAVHLGSERVDETIALAVQLTDEARTASCLL